MSKGKYFGGEIVVYDPKDPDTYPSVCAFEEEVANRFGFEGGEVLLFDADGNYVGELVKRLGVGLDFP